MYVGRSMLLIPYKKTHMCIKFKGACMRFSGVVNILSEQNLFVSRGATVLLTSSYYEKLKTENHELGSTMCTINHNKIYELT